MLEYIRIWRTWIVVLATAAVTLLWLFDERRSAPDDGAPGELLWRATAAGRDGLHLATGGLGDLHDRYLDLVRVGEQNTRLRREVDRLREENLRLLGVMQENARLRELVGFRAGHPGLTLVPARVFARDMSTYFRVVSIRLSVEDARVRVGQPVVSSAGVVGRISNVAGGYADVTLTVDPRSSIDAIVQRNRARGIVQGVGNDNDYDMRVSYLLRRDAVRPGDVVVTSGVGGTFPPDLLLGRIATVDDQSFGLFQQVVVEPGVDFSRIEEVFVIVGREGN